MVFAASARRDLDNGPLNGDKIVLYKKNTPTEDLSYGSQTDSFTTYRIPAQGSIATFSSRLARAGRLQEGDCLIIFRYQYTEDADGTTITPTLYPKKEDEVSLGGIWFKLSSMTPLMSEDNAVICYEAKGVPASTEEEFVFPLTFPIVFTGG